jgi:hypothetical protein
VQASYHFQVSAINLKRTLEEMANEGYELEVHPLNNTRNWQERTHVDFESPWYPRFEDAGQLTEASDDL